MARAPLQFHPFNIEVQSQILSCRIAAVVLSGILGPVITAASKAAGAWVWGAT